MAEKFDPYYKWLGIPPKDQPPNFYRLLGIELYEADAEVIAIAAEQRIGHVRSFQSGEYALISQKLQKKIIAVRDYLLDSEKKAEYDASLKLQLRHQNAQSLPVAQALPDRRAPPSAAQSLPIRQAPPQAAQPPPAQDSNTDYSINPIVIIKESLDWLRHHRKVTSTIVKLACATVGIVILLIVLANGKSLLAFVVDKSSYLIAKVTGSSGEKVPERLTRTRVIPGARSENPANTGENSGNENTPAPPPGERDAKAALPPAPPDSAVAAGSEKSNPPDAATAANATDRSGEKASAAPPEITSLNLPSGKIFKARLFKVELSSLADLFKDPGKDDPVLCIFYPSGQISALTTHNKGVLNGITMAFYEDHKPKTYAVYADGAIDGIIKLWNEKGERIYWCQYEKGVRNGFCCYFKDNALQMVLEIDHDTVNGVHLCGNGDLKKSFSSLEQASADKVAQKLLDEVDGLETELKLNEGVFKRQVKDELQSLKQEKVGIMTPAKRAAIQERARIRAIQSQFLITSLRNFCAL
ncbi:MAG: hypothetical protein ABSE63_11980 [Thermoguttaceae bacterium]|jgi:hypothetical protein